MLLTQVYLFCYCLCNAIVYGQTKTFYQWYGITLMLSFKAICIYDYKEAIYFYSNLHWKVSCRPVFRQGLLTLQMFKKNPENWNGKAFSRTLFRERNMQDLSWKTASKCRTNIFSLLFTVQFYSKKWPHKNGTSPLNYTILCISETDYIFNLEAYTSASFYSN